MTLRPCVFLAAVLFAVAFMSSCAPPQGTPPRIKEVLNKDAFDVGEDIRVLITARAAPGTLFRWMPPEEKMEGVTLEDYRIRGVERPWTSSLCARLLLRSFEPGEHEIPALPVSYRPRGQETWQEVTTQPLKITVNSRVSGDVLELAIKDIKGPLRRRPVLLLVVIVFVCVSAATLGIFYWTRKRRALAAVPVPPPPAHEIALEKIRELIAKDYIGRGLRQEFYFELSLIIRQYLEARFAIRAPEMTTEEFLEYLRDAATLAPVHKELLRDFLTHCDLVKFARYEPGSPEIDAALASARRLIEETRNRPEASEA